MHIYGHCHKLNRGGFNVIGFLFVIADGVPILMQSENANVA